MDAAEPHHPGQPGQPGDVPADRPAALAQLDVLTGEWEVEGVLWAPADATGTRPLTLAIPIDTSWLGRSPTAARQPDQWLLMAGKQALHPDRAEVLAVLDSVLVKCADLGEAELAVQRH